MVNNKIRNFWYFFFDKLYIIIFKYGDIRYNKIYAVINQYLDRIIGKNNKKILLKFCGLYCPNKNNIIILRR